MAQWCIDHGHELLTITADVVSGGKVAGMHGREVAIAALEHDLADALLVRALDRASRDRLDAAKLMKRAEDYGWRLLDCDGADSSDSAQRFKVNVTLDMAEEERRKIGVRTKEGLARARREGKQLGRPRQISKSVERRIKVLAGQGLSAKAIAQRLTDDGIPTARGGTDWNYSTVRGVLARQAVSA